MLFNSDLNYLFNLSAISYFRAMELSMKSHRKIGIVGCGKVGMAAAFALFTREQASELILVDKNDEVTQGEAMDLMHAQGYAGRCIVRSGKLTDLKDARSIVISAGVSQKPGETRLDLLNRNVEVLRPIIKTLDEVCPEAIIIMATNPVDILTYVAQEISSRDHSKIIGTGTMLDTSRFRTLVGEFYGIDPKSVHALVVGEHGNSEVLLWNEVTIGGRSIINNEVLGKRLDEAAIKKITEKVTMAAYHIIEKKGHTSWAIGLVISRLIQVLDSDQKTILPLSVRADGAYGIEGTCLGLPCVVGRSGVEQKLKLEITSDELLALQSSGKQLADLIKGIKL